MSQYAQYILPIRTTTWGAMEVRVNRNSRRPRVERQRGVYSASITYAQNDVVIDSGVRYVSLAGSNTGNTPASSATWWGSASNFDWVQSDPTQSLRLDQNILTKGGLSALRKTLAPDGTIPARGSRDFSFYDHLRVTGTDGSGASVSEDCTSQPWRTLLNRIFDDPQALTTIMGARVRLAGETGTMGDTVVYDPTTNDTWEQGPHYVSGSPGVESNTGMVRARELAWSGEGKVSLLRTADSAVYAERTSNAIQIQLARLTIDSATQRAESFFVADLLPYFATSDFMGGGYQTGLPGLPIYQNAVAARTGLPDIYLDPGNILFFPDGSSWENIYLQGGPHPLLVSQHAIEFAGCTSNSGMHGLTYATVLAKLSSLCQWSFDPSVDFDSDATLFNDVYNYGGSGIIEAGAFAGALSSNGVEALLTLCGRIAEFWLGSDPRCEWGVSELTSEITHAWNSGVTDILAEIAMQFGCSIRMEIDQVNKRPRLRFANRRKYGAIGTANALPSKWRLMPGSQRDQQIDTAKHVVTKYRADDTTFACPTIRGDAQSVEVYGRVKKMGMIGTNNIFTPFDLSFDRSTALRDQYTKFCEIYSGGPGFPGRHIYRTDATVTLLYTVGQHSYYSIQSLTADFSYLEGRNDDATDIVAGVCPRTVNDMFLFANGAIGFVNNPVGFILGLLGRNTTVVRTNVNRPQPPTGSNVPFLVGYTSGQMQSPRNDLAWVTDVSASDGSNIISTASQLDGTDIYGDSFVGQQVIMPKRGVFTITSIMWTGSVSQLTLDRALEFGGTSLEMRIGGPAINGGAMVLCSGVVYFSTNGSRFNTIPNEGLYGDNPGFSQGRTFYKGPWRTSADLAGGLFWLSRMMFGPFPSGVTTPDDNHGNALYSLAQVRAHELGSFVHLVRSYRGVLSDTGNLTDYGLGDTLTEYNLGASRTFATLGLEIDESETGEAANVRVTLQELPDLTAAIDTSDYPVILVGGSGTSGGAGTIGGAGGGGGGSSSSSSTSLAWLILNPPALTTNTNDWIIGQSRYTRAFISSTSDVNLTGIVGGGATDLLVLVNNGSNYITLTSEDAGSAAGNRFHFTANNPKGLGPDGTIYLYYDKVLTRWRSDSIGS